MGTTAALLTVEEFLKLPEVEGEKIELIHGEVVTTSYASFGHELVKAQVNESLVAFVLPNPIAKVFPETMYRLEEHESPQPDISVLLKERITTSTKGLYRGAPDLAIEVVSSESAGYLNTKIELYLKHGTKAVWVFYPNERQVVVHRANGQILKLGQDQTLEDHDVLPGFSVPMREIFAGL